MVVKPRKAAAKEAKPQAVMLEPLTTKWYRAIDGSWLECDPDPDPNSRHYRCTPVSADEVPESHGGNKKDV
jgi:hypothetical protein